MEDVVLNRVFTALSEIPDLQAKLSEGVSRAVDEVVDPIRSARWAVTDLSAPEKTIIGIRVENILRMDLGLPRAEHLDVLVDGVNVDIKFTIGQNWMIPPEAVDEICLLTRYRISPVAVSAGLLRMAEMNLNTGRNRDSKRSVSRIGQQGIRWLIRDLVPTQSLVGFLGTIDDETKRQITDPTVGAQERVNRLFRAYKNKSIPEAAVQAVAMHFDWTRRLRPDNRNSKAPQNLGYEVLRQSSSKDRRRLAELGMEALPANYCVAIDLS